MSRLSITVLGAGITGLWQSLILAHRGHSVKLTDRSEVPFEHASSLYAGAMLAPYCEEEEALPIIRILGLQSLKLWRQYCHQFVQNGTLVVAQPRDQGELRRFSRMTSGHRLIEGPQIASLEPDIGERFQTALFYEKEAHVDPGSTLSHLLKIAIEAGVNVEFGVKSSQVSSSDSIVDCRGMAAQEDLKSLRGVRGERAVVRTREINLKRPVRLLHPRFPIYVVPWPDHHYMIGATVIESDAQYGVTLRSALELLSTAYTLHPAFGEAEIVDIGTGIRPAFPDNCPRILLDNDRVYVNGLYRHGFLMAPALAELVANYFDDKNTESEIFVENSSQW